MLQKLFYASTATLALLFWPVSCIQDEVERCITFESLYENSLTIKAPVDGFPAGIEPDRITAEINGFDWQIIGMLEAPFVHGSALLSLPASFDPAGLQKPDQREDMGGRWPAMASDYEARVASLGDIVAWQGEQRVGRFYVSDWSGKGDANNNCFVYYHYSDRPLTITGTKAGFIYTLSFAAGWNAYANINPPTPGESNGILCTTDIPKLTHLTWRFESWL